MFVLKLIKINATVRFTGQYFKVNKIVCFIKKGCISHLNFHDNLTFNIRLYDRVYTFYNASQRSLTSFNHIFFNMPGTNLFSKNQTKKVTELPLITISNWTFLLNSFS